MWLYILTGRFYVDHSQLDDFLISKKSKVQDTEMFWIDRDYK